MSTMGSLSFAQLKDEFDESLGYIRNDIAKLRQLNSGLNYTVALLVGCACEALAAGRGDRQQPHQVFAELLPDGDWPLLAKPLFNALRNGLAHSFDTKHLHVGGHVIQIYVSWSMRDVIVIRRVGTGFGLSIGIQSLAERLCAKMNEFRTKLQSDEAARQRFRQACLRKRTAKFTKDETAAWKRLACGRTISAPATPAPAKP